MANKALNLGNTDNLLDITINQNLTIGSGGVLTLAQNPTAALQAATKQYVDGKTGVATTSAAGVMSAADKVKLNNTNVAYATCATAAATAAKVVTIIGNTNWTLTTGSIVYIKFSYTNTASSVTLNVNGTGAKNIWYAGSKYTSTSTRVTGIANYTHKYIYDGTYWVWMGKSSDDNSTYSNQSLGNGYGTCATAADTVAKVGTLSGYSLVTGGKPTIKFTYAVPASATLNINSKGAKAIYYNGAAITADIIAAGDIVTFIYDGSYYHVIAIDKMSKVTQTIENDAETVPSGAALTTKFGKVTNEIAEAVSNCLTYTVLSTIDE